MTKSILDPHSHELLLRASQGYTQPMLLLYLQVACGIVTTQPTLSRWLSQQRFTVESVPEFDDEFRHYAQLAALRLSPRRYSRTLSRWHGHIKNMRKTGHSLGAILNDLRQRGVCTSVRSIRRELGEYNAQG